MLLCAASEPGQSQGHYGRMAQLIGFSDLLVKIIHVNETTKVSMLSDNTKSVRSASWDPSGRYLVSPKS